MFVCVKTQTENDGRVGSVTDPAPDVVKAAAVLSGFRREVYACLTRRADELFELTDAVLCADGPVHALVDLTLTAEHRRGHGAMYDGLNHGRINLGRLRRRLAGLPLPRFAERQIVLAVDVSAWLRSDAACSPDRLFCHVYGRAKSASQFIPGWPYSFVAVLEPGRSSWTQVLDAVRLGPADDATAVTASQLRDVVQRLIECGQHGAGDPDILIVCDAGYDVTRLAFVLRDLPVQLLGRIRSDRIMLLPVPPRPPGATGRPPRHGGVFDLKDPNSWPAPLATTVTDTASYGKAEACAWDRLHPRLTHRGAWLDHPGTLPIVEGTLIRLHVEYLPGDRHADPLWLWCSALDVTTSQVDQAWQTYLRRFDLEHTFRLFKQTLGWTRPKLRLPQAADRWTWLLIIAYTQLRLARPLATDLRRPWEKPLPAHRLTPARVRRGFRNLCRITVHPAGAPKPTRPGPGRPRGTKNQQRATRYNVGKTVKREETLTAKKKRKG
jgi:hypothetical protein